MLLISPRIGKSQRKTERERERERERDRERERYRKRYRKTEIEIRHATDFSTN